MPYLSFYFFSLQIVLFSVTLGIIKYHTIVHLFYSYHIKQSVNYSINATTSNMMTENSV